MDWEFGLRKLQQEAVERIGAARLAVKNRLLAGSNKSRISAKPTNKLSVPPASCPRVPVAQITSDRVSHGGRADGPPISLGDALVHMAAKNKTRIDGKATTKCLHPRHPR